MFYQNPTPPPAIVTTVKPENDSCKLPLDDSASKKHQLLAQALAKTTSPATLPVAEFSSDTTLELCEQEHLQADAKNSLSADGQSDIKIIAQNIEIPINLDEIIPETINNVAQEKEQIETSIVAENTIPTQSPVSSENNTATTPATSANTHNLANLIIANDQSGVKSLLLGVVINEREVGNLDVIQEENTLLIPLLDFAQITGITVEALDNEAQLKTPLGLVTLPDHELRQINGVTYISETTLREKLATNIELNPANLALIVDLPWRRGNGQSSEQAIAMEPEVRPPSSGLSQFRQELNFNTYRGNTGWRSSSLLGGRLGGGAWRLRLENNFVNAPNLSEYFYFKRSGQFLYQAGRQQIRLHPLMNGVNLTGAQFGYTNLPKDRFQTNYSANELLSRRSQPIQSFRGIVPSASFVQLRVSGVIVAQQQVGLNGEYEFIDVSLPPNQTNDIELWVFERNNPNLPIEIRNLRVNVSDLLLPAGGNIQLAGLGFTGNLIQNTLFDDFNTRDSGKPTAFYQLRQGLSNDLTFEGALQVLPDTTQAQAGVVWRLASPAILAASVGTSRGELGYTTDLDIQLDKLQILGNSELFPAGYLFSTQTRDRFNHSLEFKYRFSNNFNLGAIARSHQDQSNSSDYISPTFYYRPFTNLSFRGRPDVQGRYLFNAFYQMTPQSRLSFNTFGDIYTSNFSHNLNREYLVSLGGEFGGDLASRYTATLNHNSRSLSGLSWRLGLAYSDGNVGPIAGASMRVLPGLFARVDYQGIPSRVSNLIGGFGDERLTISLVSDLSFAGGRLAPANYTSLSQDRGAIAGRIVVEGGKQGFDLGGSIIRVLDSSNKNVGRAITDSQGNFYVGNLPEGIYIVEIDPEQLPVELSLPKTTTVAEIASSAVTRLDFPAKLEYGLAGRITDVTGQPMAEVLVELINFDGTRVSSTVTDQFGLYRLDGVSVGNYTLRVPQQDGITNTVNLPNLQVAINKDFIYDQNLQLPIAAAAKEIKE